MYNTPVLLIIFNHPESTIKVFSEIRRIMPQKLFIAADGARSHVLGERELCAKTRLISQLVDWKCELHTRFLSENVGCNKAVLGAIDWFFENVDEGIVLESDCLPHPDFWQYASQLLEKYRHTEKIKIISGNYYGNTDRMNNDSYFFSPVPFTWGFATWRRMWKEFDMNVIDKISKKDMKRMVKSKFIGQPYTQNYWLRIARYLREGVPNMWDHMITFSIWLHDGICIVPSKNLVSNIGFHNNAITCLDMGSPYSNYKTSPILPLKHPAEIKVSRFVDENYFLYHFKKMPQGVKVALEEVIPYFIRKQLKKAKSYFKV